MTNSSGSTTSSAATLTVNAAPVITTQPKAQTVGAGSKATFSVTAAGAESYQWQFSKDGGSTWGNCTGQAATFSFTATAKYNGWKYRCIVTNATGSTASNAVTLTVV